MSTSRVPSLVHSDTSKLEHEFDYVLLYYFMSVWVCVCKGGWVKGPRSPRLPY